MRAADKAAWVGWDGSGFLFFGGLRNGVIRLKILRRADEDLLAAPASHPIAEEPLGEAQDSAAVRTENLPGHHHTHRHEQTRTAAPAESDNRKPVICCWGPAAVFPPLYLAGLTWNS